MPDTGDILLPRLATHARTSGRVSAIAYGSGWPVVTYSWVVLSGLLVWFDVGLTEDAGHLVRD